MFLYLEILVIYNLRILLAVFLLAMHGLFGKTKVTKSFLSNVDFLYKNIIKDFSSYIVHCIALQTIPRIDEKSLTQNNYQTVKLLHVYIKFC